MRNSLLKFSEYSKIYEGGAAIKSARSIRQDEFRKTLENIKEIAFPLLGIDPDESKEEYMSIGSLGKKKSESDTSGDLDIGYDARIFSDREGINYKQCSSRIAQILGRDLEGVLGFLPEMKDMPGLNILSIGWPIEGDPEKGTVQVDFIPLTDIEWSKFIYYSPDYRVDESSYKSAHRNWLFSAILSQKKIVLDTDSNGEILDFEVPVLRLSEGLFWYTKTYRGKIKERTTRSEKIPGKEVFITNDPDEFVKFTFGDKYNPSDVKTFEDVFAIINSPDFYLYDKLDKIKDKYIWYMSRVKLPVPREITEIN